MNAELRPFRDALAVLFFVSVGMMVNPGYRVAHRRQLLALSALISCGRRRRRPSHPDLCRAQCWCPDATAVGGAAMRMFHMRPMPPARGRNWMNNWADAGCTPWVARKATGTP